MSTGYEGGFTRRQELTCTETEMAAYADVVLYENEHIYIKMNSGMIRLKIGDGKTGLLNLPWAKVFDATLDDVEAIVGGFASRVMTNEKNIKNIYAAISPELTTAETDSTVAYKKIVPGNALPYATVTEVGGMSYAKNGMIIDSKVEAIESVGVNKFNIPGIDFSQNIRISEINGKKVNASFKKNTQYRFSCRSTWISGGNSMILLYIRFFYTDGTSSEYDYVIGRQNDNNTEKVFISSTGKTISNIMFIYSDEAKFKFDEIMLVEGPESKPYSHYFREVLSIPETVQNLDGWGQGVSKEHCNKIVLNSLDGTKKYIKSVKKVAFNGTENWSEGGSPAGGYYAYAVALGAVSTTGVCSHFAYNHFGGGDTDHFYTDSNGSTYFITNKYKTLEDWKAYLSSQYAVSNPVTLCYAVTTPTETDVSHLFTDNNILHVEAGGTITAVNEYEKAVPFTVKYMIKGA